MAFQQVATLHETTWPDAEIPQQMHLDLAVPDIAAFNRQHDRALALGARLRYDRSHDDQEPLCVYTDPSGHLFCIFVSPPQPA
jgi:catechol 2,3-dioxygenase-like lactoylglutathione lyase family enzyme